MAISYSYPMGTPKLTDTVLGVQYEEMKDPAVKNFSIDDIAVLVTEEIVFPIPTLQDVTDEGDTTTNDITANTFSTQGAKVWDDGTIEGASFQFSSLSGSLQSAAQDNKAWLLPDENGTIALTKYKVYTALLTQTGTSAPVATVLENTLGATITWSYVGVGQYHATASSAVFTASKTAGILSNSSSTGINAFVNISTTVFNTVTTSSGVAANNELVKNMVEIRVYN